MSTVFTGLLSQGMLYSFAKAWVCLIVLYSSLAILTASSSPKFSTLAEKVVYDAALVCPPSWNNRVSHQFMDSQTEAGSDA